MFVGTAAAPDNSGVYRFHVTELFKGPGAPYLDVTPEPGHVSFQSGETYLVFAQRCFWTGEPGCLYVSRCASQEVQFATATIDQLRGEKKGKPVASVYGMLWYRPYDRRYDPLKHVQITLRSGKRSFDTTADDRGVYAVESLPPGRYTVSAHMARGLALDSEDAEFDLPPHSSLEHDLYAFPTGEINGSVVGPDGRMLQSGCVELDTFHDANKGMKGELNCGGVLSFNRLPPGEYVLVFNPTDDDDPDAPFRRTFYPAARSLDAAQVIRLATGEELGSADIHVSNPLPTRQIKVHVGWSGKRPPDISSVQVIAVPSSGKTPYPVAQGNDTYTLNLLLNAQYKISALTFCGAPSRELQTPAALINGSDLSVSAVTLTFDGNACPVFVPAPVIRHPHN